MNDATTAMQPFAAWNATRGIWETPQLDLYGLSATVCRPWGYVHRRRAGRGREAMSV
ncbi:hypothetical protein [Janibacter sp. GXQ6167]|uniref:hypothetical protein n=1 Tax=Janibacter sp. GXQ6167 TaxID=3240791 RepID=UPI0035268CA8